MTLTPWYKVVFPREDLREGRPLDASEFAVHLDYVREGRAPSDYQEPVRFFERTYLTQSLLELASEVVRRLSGIQVETNAVFNLATAFGGGKTHALTLLYHLAQSGSQSKDWRGVSTILKKADVKTVPEAATAVFVGQEFDPRGGKDGTPLRQTPWGEIAFQLGGTQSYAVVEECDQQGRAPGGDTIRQFLPSDRPALILIDEVMNYMNRWRKSGLASQFYNFVQNLSETARGMNNVVLAVSVPASELEMAADDYVDYERLKKMLDRVGKAIMMSAEEETSEIIRRRLFEWNGLPTDGRKAAAEYGAWLLDNRHQLPTWFPVDHAVEVFEATYPFHPMALSVFERKWQELPRFQRTRGVLRMLALWVSHAYQAGFTGAHKDPLIGLGTAPLGDPLFRQAVFGQLGSMGLEGAVTTDISGKKDAHAVRLDAEAVEDIRRARLHQKVATAIFFESNGGQVAAKAEATLPELRLAVAEPGLEIGNIETVLENLVDSCYYIEAEHNRYRFSQRVTLNKLLADRRASIKTAQVRDRVRAEIQNVFKVGPQLERVYFPETSSNIPNQPVLTLVVLSPEQTAGDPKTRSFVDQLTREYGSSGRTFKSALIWVAPEDVGQLMDEARKLLAWEDIDGEKDGLGLDPGQQKQLQEACQRAQRDLRESVWRTYKKILLLGKNQDWREIDLGLVHSSAAENIVALILNRLRQDDEVTDGISLYTLERSWPAMIEWSTKAARDAFYASPELPRLLNPDAIRRTIADAVSQGKLAYAGPLDKSGRRNPFLFGVTVLPGDIEFSDYTFIIRAKDVPPPDTEEKFLDRLEIQPAHLELQLGESYRLVVEGFDREGRSVEVKDVIWEATGGQVDQEGRFTAGNQEGSFAITVHMDDVGAKALVTVKQKIVPSLQGLTWQGAVPPQKWMNFYTKILSPFVSQKSLHLVVRFEVSEGVSPQKAAEVKVALRELGLDESELHTT